VRVDHDSSYGGAVTVIRAGHGSFVGTLPLAVEAFAGHPARVDTAVDPRTGTDLDAIVLRPTVERLQLPMAKAVTLQIERQLRPGLDGQVGITDRRSTRLATLDVPLTSGAAAVRSTGTASYREMQLSVRKTWSGDQQLFASYVRSSAQGELNDFATLFQSLDAPLLQPGGISRLAADARHRVIVWGTFNLPRRIVVSPVVEWHSGFPYSIVDHRYRYVGTPNSATFPAFMAADVIVYKTWTVRQRSADLGIQLFNATNHFNPREVYPVAGAPRFGSFTNSVGPILRGFMLLKW
jgi:hypothetical protein